jgi:hypothetical protein
MRMNLPAKLLYPSTLILVAANLVPLLGIAFWMWDVFLLLSLYWMETAVIGFWTILAIAIAPHETIGPKATQTSRWFLVPFFIVHASVFMFAHFVFLWRLCAGSRADRVHDPSEFLSLVVLQNGLWLPLAALFVSRGVSFAATTLGVNLLPDRLAPAPECTPIKDDNPFSDRRALGGFYSRIVVMHLTLMTGGWIAAKVGHVAPLVLMVALKIAIDLKLQLKDDFPDGTKPQAAR